MGGGYGPALQAVVAFEQHHRVQPEEIGALAQETASEHRRVENLEAVFLQRREETRFELDGLAKLLGRQPTLLTGRAQQLAGRIALRRRVESAL